MISEDVLSKIKSKGYWRVIIRPLKSSKKNSITLNECKNIVESCEVRYRGWPYPIIKDIISGDKYVWGGVDWQNHIEYWRFYPSRQFIHFFAMREDWEHEVKNLFGEAFKNPHKPGSGLSILSSLYTFTEIFEFALRLQHKASIEPGIYICIELYGTNNRRLFFYDIARGGETDFIARIDKMSYEKEFCIEEFLSDPQKHALDACIHIFEKFNWRNIPRHILETDQKKLFGKKSNKN